MTIVPKPRCLPALAALFLAAVAGCDSGGSEPAAQAEQAPARAEGRVFVEVTAEGYIPHTVEVAGGKPVTLVFKRTTESECGKEVVFPDHNIRKTLPLNEEVEIVLTPKVDERIAFTCGMNMYEGTIVAGH